MSDSNEQHDTEICLARAAVEEDVAKNSEDIIQQFDCEYQSHLIQGWNLTMQSVCCSLFIGCVHVARLDMFHGTTTYFGFKLISMNFQSFPNSLSLIAWLKTSFHGQNKCYSLP